MVRDRNDVVVAYTDGLEQVLEDALDFEVVGVLSVHADDDLLVFIGQFVEGVVGDIDGGDFIEVRLRVAVVVVAGEDFHHRTEGRAAHDTGVFAERVADDDVLPELGVLRQAELVVGLRGDEGEGLRLGKTAREEGVLHEAIEFLPVGERCIGGAAQLRVRDVVVSVEPGDLLGDVCLGLDIDPEGRRGDDTVFDFEADLLEDGLLLVSRAVDADELVDPVGVEGKGDDFFRRRIDIDDAVVG